MPKGVYERTSEMKSCHPRALSEQDALEAYELYRQGVFQKDIAKKFGCGINTLIRSLKKTGGLVYKHKRNSGCENPAWKGGKITDPDGYILIRSPEHPMAKKDGYLLEHRLVMSGLLGRNLTKDEVVHHRNGIRSDNRPENLLLFASNGVHLGVELLGKVPKWTEEGFQNMCQARKQQTYTGAYKNVANVAKLRKKKIQKFLRDTDFLENIELEARLELPPMPKRPRRRKRH